MSDLNKAILKVAQSNPEFRKALTAELSKSSALKEGVFINTFGHAYVRRYATALLTRRETLMQWDRLDKEAKEVAQAFKKAGIPFKLSEARMGNRDSAVQWQQQVVPKIQARTHQERDAVIEQVTNALDANHVLYYFV